MGVAMLTGVSGHRPVLTLCGCGRGRGDGAPREAPQACVHADRRTITALAAMSWLAAGDIDCVAAKLGKDRPLLL
jgi:hypothetical protein